MAVLSMMTPTANIYVEENIMLTAWPLPGEHILLSKWIFKLMNEGGLWQDILR
jgi:hypothetical protein